VATAVALALMVLVGLSLGLLGSGGSIITLPVLVYIARIPVAVAVAMSLVIVGATAAMGALVQGRRTGFDARAALVFAVTGAAGAYVGSRLTHLVSGTLLMFIFGSLMVAAGLRMLNAHVRHRADQGRCDLRRCSTAGLAVGVLTGFLGVGGGFLILPALLLFAGTEMRRAVPTSLSVIAANCVGGLIGQAQQVSVPIIQTAALLTSALAGMYVGTLAAGRLSSQALQRVFAWSILALGSVIVVRNAWLLL
jgi:hypothetical protein